MNERTSAATIRNIEHQRNRLEKRAARWIKKGLTGQQEQALSLPAGSPQELLRNIESITVKPMEDAFRTLYTKIGGFFAEQTAKHLEDIYKKQELDDVWSLAMSQYVRDLGTRIVDITQTTKDRITRTTQSVIDEGFEKGWSIQRMQREIRKASGISNVYRSTRIARTETVNASNYGSLKGAQSTGLALNKVWLTTRDGRERTSHAEADGQSVGMNEKFNVGGASMNHPGDPAGGADNVINCRCSLIYERQQANNNFEDLEI